MNFKIHNMIFSTSVNSDINLDKLSADLDESEYEPEQFPGLIYRTTNPRSGILAFTSGKINIVGVKTIREAREVYRQAIEILLENGVKVDKASNLKVENIVASSKITNELNLDDISFEMENTEYEPEQFPGLIYRMDEPRLVFLLFSSGRIICVGARKSKDIEIGIKKLTKELKRFKKTRKRT